MDKKKLIPMICAAFGILAGIGMIFATALGNAFPKPLWFLISAGLFANAVGIFYNFGVLRSKDKKDK